MGKSDHGRWTSREAEPFEHGPVSARDPGDETFVPIDAPPGLRRHEYVKLLFLAANAFASHRIGIENEHRAIARRLRSSPSRDSVVLVSAWAVTFEDLQRCLLEHKPDIVHFAVHGNASAEIVLFDEKGEPAPIPANAMDSLFESFGNDVSLVVLNACFSQAQAKSLCQRVGLAIGMVEAIGDEDAVAFSGALYEALGYGRSVRDSFALGVTAIKARRSSQHHVPRLLTRRNDDADRSLFPAPGFFSSLKNGLRNRRVAPILGRRRSIEISFKISLFMLLVACAWKISAHYSSASHAVFPDTSAPPIAIPSASADSRPAASQPHLDREPQKRQVPEVALVLAPIDAHVYQHQVDLGTMPISVPIPDGETVEVEIRREGFWAKKIKLDGSQPKRVIRLVPHSIPGADARGVREPSEEIGRSIPDPSAPGPSNLEYPPKNPWGPDVEEPKQ